MKLATFKYFLNIYENVDDYEVHGITECYVQKINYTTDSN